MSITMNKDKVNDKNNTKILTIKQEFSSIREIIRNANTIFNNLHNKTNTLKNVYDKLLHQNKNNLYVFGLDSFKFQNKLINVEFQTMEQYYCLITNRMFCDYFKLNQIIRNYILEKIDDEKIKMRVKQQHTLKETYDYINIYKFYDISKTSEIFNNVINMIVELVDYSSSLTKELQNYKSKKKNGFNINNFIYTFEYNNVLLQQQIGLYLNYVSFFLRLHKKYIIRFTNKIQLMHQQVTQDITFEDQSNFNEESLSKEYANDGSNLKLDTDSDQDDKSSTTQESNSSTPSNETSYINGVEYGKINKMTNKIINANESKTITNKDLKIITEDINETKNGLNQELFSMPEDNDVSLPNGDSLFSFEPDNLNGVDI